MDGLTEPWRQSAGGDERRHVLSLDDGDVRINEISREMQFLALLLPIEYCRRQTGLLQSVGPTFETVCRQHILESITRQHN